MEYSKEILRELISKRLPEGANQNVLSRGLRLKEERPPVA